VAYLGAGIQHQQDHGCAARRRSGRRRESCSAASRRLFLRGRGRTFARVALRGLLGHLLTMVTDPKLVSRAFSATWSLIFYRPAADPTPISG